jgi:hypothetical protein
MYCITSSPRAQLLVQEPQAIQANISGKRRIITAGSVVRLSNA